MKITRAEFITSGTRETHFPDDSKPEFAFLGRSNVGKSSLMNMIMGRKNLVKTGAKPGVTQTINFFMVNNSISLADLPGFGYAKLPDRIRSTFMPMITEYINRRGNLRLVFLLVDIRRTPDDFEKGIIDLCLAAGRPVAVVITKSDKIPRSKHQKSLKQISTILNVGMESLLVTSTLSGQGKKEIHSAISSMLKG